MTMDKGVSFNWCRLGLIIITTSIYVTTTAEEKCKTIDIKSEHKNKVLTAHILGVYTDWSNYRCALRCMGVRGCLSISYCRQNQDCVLHSMSSTSVKFMDFLAVTGFVFSDLTRWNMKNVCGSKTCAVGETCLPIGSRFICKDANQAEVTSCSPNTTSLNCYMSYPNKDLYGYDIASHIHQTNLVDCMIYCNTYTPTYKSLLYKTIENTCFCKSKSVWSHLADGQQLVYRKNAVLYQRIQ